MESGNKITEQWVSKETAQLALEKGCNLIKFKYHHACFSRSGDATTFCENYVGKLSETSFRITDFGRDEHGGNYSCLIELAEMDDLPSQELLKKWLRDVHQIEIAVQWFDNCYIKAVQQRPFKANTYRIEGFKSYEEIFELALVDGLNLIK